MQILFVSRIIRIPVKSYSQSLFVLLSLETVYVGGISWKVWVAEITQVTIKLPLLPLES